MLAKYAIFTVLTSALSFWLMSPLEEPYKYIHDFYNTFCVYLNKEGRNFFFSKALLTCVDADEDLLQSEESELLFTEDLLKQYSGNSEILYLSILGEVFDVSKGKKHYGLGQGYHGFTGKDGSKAFVTGDFTEEGLTDDILDLPVHDLLSLDNWSKFYHKEYSYKGKLIGRFYNDQGRPTGYYYRLQQRLSDGEEHKRVSDEFKLNFPPCNVEFDVNTGSRVWCSKHSGGISRDWIGVPRKVFEPGAKTHRCACINLTEQSNDERERWTKNAQEYEDCHPKASSCQIYT